MRLPPLRQGCELYSLHTPHSTMLPIWAVVKPNTPNFGHNCILHIIIIFVWNLHQWIQTWLHGGGHWASPVVNSYCVWTAREKSASFLSGEKSASRDIAKAVVSSVELGYRNALLQMTWELSEESPEDCFISTLNDTTSLPLDGVEIVCSFVSGSSDIKVGRGTITISGEQLKA